MTRILTYGTFDVLHIGHINLLERAKRLGNELYVGLSTDSFNEIKNKRSVLDFENRYAVLKSLRFVDCVFPENNWEQKIPDVIKYEVDIFAIGDDWYGKFDFLKYYCDVVYLPRTPDISTTMLKEKTSKILMINN